MHRAGPFLAGMVLLAIGIVGLFGALTGRLWPTGWYAHALSGTIMALALLFALAPRGNRRARGLALLIVAVVAVTVQLALAFTWRLPPVGLVPSVALLVAGAGTILAHEIRRRNIVARLEAGRLTVHARRQDTQHALPLAGIQEVTVHRGTWGRLWGYATFIAHVRRGDVAKHIDRPVVAESGSTDPLMGSGWDEEGRFLVVAAHPYKRLKARLEEQIRMARLPAREREEAELAQRLGEDLEQLQL
jgi:hypothetical protein